MSAETMMCYLLFFLQILLHGPTCLLWIYPLYYTVKFTAFATVPIFSTSTFLVALFSLYTQINTKLQQKQKPGI